LKVSGGAQNPVLHLEDAAFGGLGLWLSIVEQKGHVGAALLDGTGLNESFDA
jgi:hypothetical protein